MKAILVALLLSSLLLAGCSGSGGASTTPQQDSEGRYVIHLTSGSMFSPANAKVPKGATVVWHHDGGAPHDVQARDGSFSSGPAGGMTEGEEFTHTFNETGTWEVFCHIHEGQGMKGKITVE
jgi:plastocyanin